MLRLAQSLLAAVAAGALLLGAGPLFAQGPWRESFESPVATWVDSGGNVPYRLEEQQRTSADPHSGAACERVQVAAAPNGTAVYISHPIGKAIVINELEPTVWVRSDQPGVQLLVRVVLPRATDPRTGQVATILIPGSTYTRVGGWEQLRIENLPILVQRQTRALRAEWRTAVDLQEAFVDHVLLNLYHAGRRQVWIDDLEVAGHVGSPVILTGGETPVPTGGALTSGGPKRTVELNGSLLLADGRPLFPRAIEHQGEPLAFVQRLGFNTVKLAAPAKPELLAEAQRLGLWVVAPPPGRMSPTDVPPNPLQLDSLGTLGQNILAWDLGAELTGRELEATKRWSEALRRVSGLVRPLVCEPQTDLRVYSRYTDMLMTRREPLGTSFELNDFGTWLRERPRLARPGTPFWTVIQTQLSAAAHEQCQRLGGGPGVSTVSIEQVRVLASQAVAAGARGLVFASRARLDAEDPATRLRAMGLELLNLELELLEPWGAGGSFVSTIPVTSPPVASSPLTPRAPGQRWQEPPLPIVPDVEAALLQTERAKLVLPLWSGRGAQYVPGQLAASGVSLVVPGVPDTNEVYRLTPSGLQPARHQRVTGGIRVTLGEFGQTSHLVLTPDPVVVSGMMKRLVEVGPRMAELQRELSAIELQRATETDSRLATQGRFIPPAGRWLISSREELQQADQRLSQRDFDGAVEHARRSLRPLQLLQRAHWDLAAKTSTAPTTSPLLSSFSTLPEYWNFLAQLNQARWSPNQLPHGNFEDLDAVLRAGWQQYIHPHEGIAAGAELSTEVRDRKTGRYSLRLSARPASPDANVGLVESASLWITTPGVPLAAGQWVRIIGWVYVPRSITGSLDGLMIIDSLGGEALAERIGQAPAWRPFVMYRAASQPGVVTLTVALTGLGEAWLDDVTIEPLATPGRVPGGESLPIPPAQATTAPFFRR